MIVVLPVKINAWRAMSHGDKLTMRVGLGGGQETFLKVFLEMTYRIVVAERLFKVGKDLKKRSPRLFYFRRWRPTAQPGA